MDGFWSKVGEGFVFALVALYGMGNGSWPWQKWQKKRKCIYDRLAYQKINKVDEVDDDTVVNINITIVQSPSKSDDQAPKGDGN